MDAHKDALTDAALEREIESALAVEPSPDFNARVRARVAAEPVSSAWFPWRSTAFIAAAAVVVLTGLGMWFESRSRDTTAARRATNALPAQTSGSVEPESSRAVPDQAATSATLSAPAGVRHSRTSQVGLPPVIVSANEVETFQTLVAISRQSGVSLLLPSSSAETTIEPEMMAELAPIVIAPLDIQPVVTLTSPQGEGE